MTSAVSIDVTLNSRIYSFPRPRLPALNTFPDIAGDTVAITFVGYAVSVSLAMIYADKHGYSIHPNQVNCGNFPAASVRCSILTKSADHFYQICV